MNNGIVGSYEEIGLSRNHVTGKTIHIKGGYKVFRAIIIFAQFGKITFSREQEFKGILYYSFF